MKRTTELSKCPVCFSECLEDLIQTSSHMHESDELFSFSCCIECRGAFINPPVSGKGLQRYYPSTYLPYRGAAAWGKYHRFVEQSQRQVDARRAKLCRSYYKPEERISVLDVGCGKPTFLAGLSNRTDWSLTGVDFSSKGWESSRTKCVNLIEGEMHTAQFDRQFELVTMWHYLEHDFTPHATLQAVRNAMPLGGKLIIEVPDYQSLTAKLQKENWEGWHTPRHAVLYSQQALSILLSANGFQPIRYNRYGTLSAFPLWWMGLMEKKGIDWTQSMESKFVSFVGWMICTSPLFALEKTIPLGIQTVVAMAK